MVEWTTPRKAAPLREALDHRIAGGSIKKLCFQRRDDPRFPPQATMSRWIKRYDKLAKHHNPDTAFEQAYRRIGRVSRPSRPPALSANNLNNIARRSREFREQTRAKQAS